MTIAISLKVNDGLVFAADSASTLISPTSEGTQIVNIYNNANKIFNLFKGKPIGAITWGAGNIGNASISTLMKDLRRRFSGGDTTRSSWIIKDTYEIKDIANYLKQFFFDEIYLPSFKDGDEHPPIGFIVAGYSSNKDMAEEYQIDIRNGECSGPTLVRNINESGLTWSGQTEAISRLLLGFDSKIANILKDNLGVPDEQIPDVIHILQENLTIPIAIPAMPFRDAIDLAEFLVHVAINFSRFGPGVQTVGGPIEVAAISKHEGFKWIRRKHYYSRELNPED